MMLLQDWKRYFWCRRRIYLLFFAVIIYSFPQQGFCADPGTEVIQRVYDRYEGDDSEATYAMTLEDEGGDRRVREMTMFRKDFGERLGQPLADH